MLQHWRFFRCALLRCLCDRGDSTGFSGSGGSGLGLSLPIAVAIILLLAIVVSYRQTIRAYPQGGGSYIVARENLGVWV